MSRLGQSPYLHLGCGAKYLAGWVNADGCAMPIVEGKCGHPDEVLDIHHDCHRLAEASLDWIYTSHTIEHVYPDLLPGILLQLRRSLRPGGRLTIATTSLEGIFNHRFLRADNGDAWECAMFGNTMSSAHPMEAHRDCFTYAKLERLLLVAGFSQVRPWRTDDYPAIHALDDYARSCALVTCFAEGVK